MKDKTDAIDAAVEQTEQYKEDARGYAETASNAKDLAEGYADSAEASAQSAIILYEPLAEQVNENTANIQVNSARIDAFTTLAAGSTTGDAELIDARVGADGITYATAGDAIRGQVSNLKTLIFDDYEELVFPGGDIDVTFPIDFSEVSNIFDVAHGAITYTSGTSLAIQYKITINGTATDILRKSNSQSAMTATKYWAPLTAKYIRVVLHSTSATSVSIKLYKNVNVNDYNKIFEWHAQAGYTADENLHELFDLSPNKTYNFAFAFGGFNVNNATHIAVQSGTLYRYNSFTAIEDVMRHQTNTGDRTTAQNQGAFIKTTFTPSAAANALRFYFSEFTSDAYFVMYAKELESDYQTLFDNSYQGLIKSIYNNGPRTFRRTGTFGSDLSGIEGLTIIDDVLYTAHLGNGGTLAKWDNKDKPLHHVDISSTKISHVISMDAMANGMMLVANKNSDDTRSVYALDPSDLDTITTYNIPETCPNGLDNTAVIEFVGELNSNELVVIYANPSSETLKSFYVFKFNISDETISHMNTFTYATRYLQDGCMVGNMIYLMANWGYIDEYSTANNVVLVYDCLSWSFMGAIKFNNFLELEGCAFNMHNNSKPSLYFAENGGNWLYSTVL